MQFLHRFGIREGAAGAIIAMVTPAFTDVQTWVSLAGAILGCIVAILSIINLTLIVRAKLFVKGDKGEKGDRGLKGDKGNKGDRGTDADSN